MEDRPFPHGPDIEKYPLFLSAVAAGAVLKEVVSLVFFLGGLSDVKLLLP